MSQSETQSTSVLDTFDHVVVLMLENRSFDNLLGYLYSQKYPVPPGKKFEGVDGKNISNPIPAVWQFKDQHGKLVTEVPVAPISDVNLTAISPPFPDPGEDYPHVNTQLFNPDKPDPFNRTPYNLPFPLHGPAMSGFVSDYILNYINTEFPDGTKPSPDQAFYDRYKTSCKATIRRTFPCFPVWRGSLRCSITGFARCRARPSAIAISGMPARPGAMSSTPARQTTRRSGQRAKHGCVGGGYRWRHAFQPAGEREADYRLEDIQRQQGSALRHGGISMWNFPILSRSIQLDSKGSLQDPGRHWNCPDRVRQNHI